MEYKNPNEHWKHDNEVEDDFNYEGALKAGCIQFLIMSAILFVLIIVCSLLGGCSPKIIERVVEKTDTCFIQKERRDSICMKDSVYVKEWMQGDTVRIETLRWRDRWHERIIRDTAYIAKRDSIVVTKTEQVEKPLSGWQQFRLWTGNIVLIALVLAVVIIMARWWLKGKLLW